VFRVLEEQLAEALAQTQDSKVATLAKAWLFTRQRSQAKNEE
jgi:hypothetical protein